MKKLITIILALTSALLLTGCQKKEEKADDTPVIDITDENYEDPDQIHPITYPIKWFDGYHYNELLMENDVWGYRLDEFPLTKFRCTYEKLEAIMGGEPTVLFYGNPILSIYFEDMNGDDKVELCGTVRVGFGMISNKVIVYDYAAGEKYELSSPGAFDYVLNKRDEELIVEKRYYNSDAIIESGKLILEDGELRMQRS